MANSQLSKEDLEKQKLELEVLELKRKWLFKPQYFFSLLTFLLTASTIIWSLSSGVLDIKYQSLLLDKKNLEFDIKKFEEKKDSILKSYLNLVDSLNNQKQNLYYLDSSLQNSQANEKRLFLEKQAVQLKAKEVTGFYKKTIDSLLKVYETHKIPQTNKSLDSIQIIIPNAFSPGTLGATNSFKVKGNDLDKLNYFQFTIYDRFGKLVFRTNNFNQGWDGKVNGMVPNETEIYVYTCEIGVESITKHRRYRGYVTLIK